MKDSFRSALRGVREIERRNGRATGAEARPSGFRAVVGPNRTGEGAAGNDLAAAFFHQNEPACPFPFDVEPGNVQIQLGRVRDGRLHPRQVQPLTGGMVLNTVLAQALACARLLRLGVASGAH
jgi:hypothetical protein